MPDINNLEEEEFILAHSFRSSSPWLVGAVVLGYGKTEHHGFETVAETATSRQPRSM
jgi:hypothetical protein